MKNLWQNIKKAIFGKDYLADFGNKTFWRGVGHLSILVLVQAVILIAMQVYYLSPLYSSVKNNGIETIIKENVSSDVEVTIKDGVISTKNNLPITIPLSEDFKKKFSVEESPYKNLIVVDPAVEDPLKAKETYSTVFLATKDKVLVTEDKGVRVMDTKETPDFVITQESLISKYQEIKPLITKAMYVLPVLAIIPVTLISMILYMVLAIITSLIFMLIAKIKKTRIGFSKGYIISLYALSILVIIEIIFALFRISIGFWWLLVMIILGIVNIKGSEKVVPVSQN